MMNAVFIHVPKTGGICVENTLRLASLRNNHRIKNNFRDEGMVSFGHLRFSKLLKRGLVSREFQDNAFKFCFCRNPYDRAVSHWSYTMRKHPDRLAPGTTFVEFTRGLTERGDFRCQTWWLKDVEPDFIGRFERFEDDLRKVADILGRKVGKIPHMNGSLHAPYQMCYCEESKERIEKFYQPDFEYFGYEFDDTLLH